MNEDDTQTQRRGWEREREVNSEREESKNKK